MLITVKTYPTLFKEAKDKQFGTSLAVLKPKEVIDFIWEPSERDWDPKKIAKIIVPPSKEPVYLKTKTEDIFFIRQN